jgi:hypothetical protein
MARPGLEPGTPRFSVVDWDLSNSRGIPAIHGVPDSSARRLDVRKLRSFVANLGTERRFGTQWPLPALAPSSSDARASGVLSRRRLACEAWRSWRRRGPKVPGNRQYPVASRASGDGPDTAQSGLVWSNEWPNGETHARDDERARGARDGRDRSYRHGVGGSRGDRRVRSLQVIGARPASGRFTEAITRS